MAGKLDRKSLMKRLSEAQANGVGNNFKDGKYRLAVKKLSLEDGFKGTRFQSVFTVMNSIPIQSVWQQGPQQGQLVNAVPNAVGSDVDWLCTDLDKQDSPGPGNVRRFIIELFGVKDLSDEDYLETLAEMCDIDVEGNPLREPLNEARGMVIDMETVRIVTKTNKKEIVVCRWSSVTQSPEQQAEVVKWMNAIAMQRPTLPAGQTAEQGEEAAA